MQRLIVLTFLSLFLFSCSEREKTYEELEAEVLCDVLPEILEREMKFYALKPPPPPALDSIKYSFKQIDSIQKAYSLFIDKFSKESKVYYENRISKLKENKKIEQNVLDTLLYVQRLSVDNTDYRKFDLDSRRVDLKEFDNSNIKVRQVSYSNTFEQQDRNSGDQVLFLTRVLVNEKNDNSFFSVVKFFGTYHVFCRKTKDNKWKIRKVISDKENKLRSE